MPTVTQISTFESFKSSKVGIHHLRTQEQQGWQFQRLSSGRLPEAPSSRKGADGVGIRLIVFQVLEDPLILAKVPVSGSWVSGTFGFVPMDDKTPERVNCFPGFRIFTDSLRTLAP